MPAEPQPVKQATVEPHGGRGKIILFGEHFVVHGATALSASIQQYTSCQLQVVPGGKGWQVVDDRPAVPGYIDDKREEQRAAHDLVLQHLGISLETHGLKIHLGGPLVPASGVGASASNVVALARALSELYGLHLSDEAVNNAAFIGEKGYHGNPSGVDNTTATFGGVILYRRRRGVDGRTSSTFTILRDVPTAHVVVASTGITSSTSVVVADVAKRREAFPQYYAELEAEYRDIVNAAVSAMREGDWGTVGKLMTKNHAVLDRLGVSCDELNGLVEAALTAGALGAKLSGTGRGGIVVCLAANRQSQTAIAEQMRGHRFAKHIWCYDLGGNSALASKM